jgi:esterase/lipase
MMKSKPIIYLSVGLILLVLFLSWNLSPADLNTEDTKKSSSLPDAAASSGTAVDDLIEKQSENHSMRWFYSNTQSEPKGVALVIHGLNLRPDRMQPLISELADSGIDVLGVSLRGHGENYVHGNDTDEEQSRLEAFKNVSYQLWLNEAYLAYLQVKTRGEKNGVPIFLTAFSLGGLIGLDLFASHADVQFDGLILFAPAIRLCAIIYLERVLSLFPRLVIPSMAPETYLANKKGTPIAAYNAMFEGLNRFDKNAGQKLNVPTLIFIDEQDEFIALEKLKILVKDKKWAQWQFYLVEKDKTAEDERFYHHIIDASSTGKTVWQDMMKTVKNLLLDHTSK